jgi:hypothetical protein
MPTTYDTPLAFVAPSGEGILVEFGGRVTGVQDNDETQAFVFTGSAFDGPFTASFGGQTTANVARYPGAPYRYFQWNTTLAATGAYDLAVNLGNGSSGHILYEPIDGTTILGQVAIPGNGVSPPTPAFADPGGLLTRAGSVVQWYPLGRFTFSGTDAHVRVSCDAAFGADTFAVDNLRMVRVSDGTVTRVGPALPPATSVYYGFNYDPYTVKTWQCVDNASGVNGVSMRGEGAGARPMADPAVFQSRLRALSSIGAGNVTVTGEGSAISPLLVRFVGPFSDATQALLAASDSTVEIRRAAVGGSLPKIVIDGGSPIQLTHGREWHYDAQPAAGHVYFPFDQTIGSPLKIGPNSVVTMSALEGWATTTLGTAPAVSGVAVDNRSGGQLYRALPTSVTMETGYNVHYCSYFAGTLAYTNLARFTTSFAEYPNYPAEGRATLDISIAECAVNYVDGGVLGGKTWPNVPPGAYWVMWDSVTGQDDCTLTASVGTCTETGTPVVGQTTNNKRSYTLGGDSGHWGSNLHAIFHGISNGDGTYHYGLTNLRICPAATDPANIPLWRPDFAARFTGMSCVRWAPDINPSFGNATTLADYRVNKDYLTRTARTRVVTAGIAQIKAYIGDSGTAYRFPPSLGLAFEFQCPAHGFSHGQFVWIRNYGGTAPLLTDGTHFALNGTAAHVYYLDADRFVLFFRFQNPNYPTLTPAGTTMVGTLTNPSSAAYVEMTLDMSRPIDDMIQFCNENDLDFWLNISPSTTDQGTIDLITFLGTHLKPGLKLYAEWANEIWNFGNQPYYWATINGYSAGISDENSFGPFQCVESKRYWDLGKPAWIAAGRDGNDFLRVLAGQHPDTSKAAGHAQTCNAHGVTFDRYATAPYLPNQPAFNYVADGSYNAASTATWTTEQHIDVLEANYTFGGFEHEPGYIIDALTGKQSDGSHLYPQFVGVPLVVYEGGPDFLSLYYGGNGHPANMNHAIARNTRWYGLYQHIKRVYQDGDGEGRGFVLWLDFIVDGVDTDQGLGWPSHSGTAQPDYVPGNPTQDAIQNTTPDRLDIVHSVTGGAMRRWASLLGSSPVPDFTLAVTGSGTLTRGSNATRTVTLAVLDGYTGTATLSASGLPTGVPPGFSRATLVGGGVMVATLTLTASGSATLGTATITVTATDASNSLAHSATFSVTVVPAASSGTPPVSVAPIARRLRAARR